MKKQNLETFGLLNLIIFISYKVYSAHKDQIVSQLTPDENKSLQQFIQQAVGQASAQGPSVNKYTSQSGEIFGILKNMQDQFEANLSTAQKEEASNSQSYTDLKNAKEKEISAGQKPTLVAMV